MSRRVTLVVLGTVALATVLGASLLEQRLAGQADEYRLQVMWRGESLASFSVEELNALGTRRIRMQGMWEEGPPVLAVLRASGVKRFDRLVVKGMGVRDDGRLELVRSQVDEDVLLDIAKRGTAKVCGPRIAHAERVRDVTAIEVE